MCEELSAGAVMTDGARSPLQREVIKKSNYECRGGTRECRGAKTGKGELDQIRQMIRAISQSRTSWTEESAISSQHSLGSGVSEGSRV